MQKFCINTDTISITKYQIVIDYKFAQQAVELS